MTERYIITYETPKIEVIEVEIEKGFSNSLTEGLSGEKDPINW